MPPLLAALALVAGVAVVTALTADTQPEFDLEWSAFLRGHSELH